MLEGVIVYANGCTIMHAGLKDRWRSGFGNFHMVDDQRIDGKLCMLMF